jgi:hypothetical protein
MLLNKSIPFYWYSWSENITAIDEDIVKMYFNTNNTFSSNDNKELRKLFYTSKARDAAHCGKAYNEKVANCFYNLTKKP